MIQCKGLYHFMQDICYADALKLTLGTFYSIIFHTWQENNIAGVAELADAYGSGPYGGNSLGVQVPSPAPLNTKSGKE